MATLFHLFQGRLTNLSDEDIVRAFNREVGVQTWTNARASYLAALRHEFERRGIDYSSIGDAHRMNYGHKVVMSEERILHPR